MSGKIVTADTSDARDLFDSQALVERCLGNLQLADRLLTKFDSISAADVVELRAALILGDRAQIQRTSHRLKGSASSVGSNLLAAAAARLENKSLDCSVAELEVLVRDLSTMRQQFVASASLT